MNLDADGMGQLAFRVGLLTEEQLRECLSELPSKSAPPDEFLALAMRKGYVTQWQASKLQKGDRDGYLLGGYKLLYRIAGGTFGRVFRAENPRTGESVAVKVLRNRWSEDLQKISLFEREGKLGLNLRHPNIVSILAVNRDPVTGKYYIVMEFVEGGNLREILNIRKKLAPPEALRILEEAASGLAYAYSRGMTHRDIKASNILLSAQGVAKLVDFGLAEWTATHEEDDTLVDQSVDYAGLEGATGCKPGDIRSDIYFLGCVFFQMLTGRPLLTMTKDVRARKNRTRFDIVHQIPRDDPDVPHMLHALLTRMVTLEAGDRFQTPAMLVEAIRNVKREFEGEGGGPTVAAGQTTLFVVEPNQKLQDVFRDKLKKRGYKVLISIDASRALQRFQQAPYHALIVDIASAGEVALEPFEQVVREANSMGLGFTGFLIFDAEQQSLARRFSERPGIVPLFLPAKELLAELRVRVPLAGDAEANSEKT